MTGNFHLHAIHIMGTWMIAEGTNGLSRGYLTMGVMLGVNILSFVPLHLDSITCEPTLHDWVLSW
jgi:hypothetical protein